MLRKKIIVLFAYFAGLTGIAAAASLPIIAAIKYSQNATEFKADEIGIYIEKEWMPAFNQAIKIYNQSEHQYPIKALENNSFTAIELIDTLGYRDQSTADLLYLPMDRIPTLAEKNKALLYFDSPESLLYGFDSKIWADKEETKKALASIGLGVIETEKGEKKEGYFGIQHNAEALLLFTKGRYTEENKFDTIKSIIDDVNNNNWSDSMYAFKMNDLWFTLGILAGYLKLSSGIELGQALSYKDLNIKKYYSAMTSIDPVKEQEIYKSIANLSSASTDLKSAIDFIYNVYQKANENNQDWLFKSYNANFVEKFKNAKNAVVLTGIWDAALLSDPSTKVRVVPEIENGKQYKQGPGGWVYAFNQRNYGNDRKIKEMKDFLNILLTDHDVIKAQYQYMSKIPTGDVAKKVFESDNNLSTYDKSAITSVLETSSKGFILKNRPDAGNQTFNQVWGSWDNTGWSSVQVHEAITNNSGSSAVAKLLQTSFKNMITRFENE